ncbi:hypothetical protein VMCG_09452 [Cytospora schulzeri]|uniref:Uncharacterized protein n=1 Tax=Cytospora schulzeri TaxID=448051 RepID=A0A423VKH5_9PEZI|nr:hypothetical protein VMCG_09452 [Valsa malicola]
MSPVTLVKVLALAHAPQIVFFVSLMVASIHKSVMAAREDRLAGGDHHKSGSVLVKLAKWIGGGIVLFICAFFALFTKDFWKQSWADLKLFFSPYSWPGVWANAYTCGRCCNADPDHDPELAGISRLRKETSSIVAQAPKPNAVVAVTETPAPQRPALAIVVEV